jgi:hypothetical protein
MRFTNRFNLPDPFVAALSSDDYARGEADFTTTELVRPVRIQSYTRAHWDELEEDVSDRVWALSGQVKHVILERIARTDPKRYLVEQRLETTVPGGRRISGQIDLFDLKDYTQYDWKETSVWKFILGNTKEWEEQGNINLYLLRQNGVRVKALTNVALLKDWKIRKARTTKRGDYPQCAINVVPLPMWSVGQQQDFIMQRIAAFEEGKDNPPVCTKEERWQRDAVYAVMRKGRKAAIRLCDNRDQAEAVAKSYNDDTSRISGQHYVEERPTEPVRCLDFCPVQKYCDFGLEAEGKWKANQP